MAGSARDVGVAGRAARRSGIAGMSRSARDAGTARAAARWTRPAAARGAADEGAEAEPQQRARQLLSKRRRNQRVTHVAGSS
jgi:hypothetical protein